MSSNRMERRSALVTIGAAAAAALPVPGQNTEHGHDQPPAKPKAALPYKPRFFTAKELEVVATLADLIIPRTDTPGAQDAGAHMLIDKSVRAADRKRWKDGLSWLAKQSFHTKTEPEQIAILQRASEESGTLPARFFKLVKDSTIDAYYATREGLQTELGWNANTYLPEFKGCTHPEHQS